MATRVFLHGRVVPPEDARVSVFDRGFLYGDSVYEVARTFAGRPFALGEHLDRLEASAARLALTLPPRDAIIDAIERTLAASGNAESYVRVVVTRGEGEIGLDPLLGVQPCLVVIVKELRLPDERLYREGASVAVVGIRRNHPLALDPAIKSGNYLNNILALGEARRAGADDAIMCDAEGRITEGSSFNVFAVRDGRLVTPPLSVGILDGITRRHVVELARRAGIGVQEVVLYPEDLQAAAEVFVTSSIRGILPVGHVDGAPVGSGGPGPMTRRLMQLYLDHARAASARPEG